MGNMVTYGQASTTILRRATPRNLRLYLSNWIENDKERQNFEEGIFENVMIAAGDDDDDDKEGVRWPWRL